MFSQVGSRQAFLSAPSPHARMVVLIGRSALPSPHVRAGRREMPCTPTCSTHTSGASRAAYTFLVRFFFKLLRFACRLPHHPFPPSESECDVAVLVYSLIRPAVVYYDGGLVSSCSLLCNRLIDDASQPTGFEKSTARFQGRVTRGTCSVRRSEDDQSPTR